MTTVLTEEDLPALEVLEEVSKIDIKKYFSTKDKLVLGIPIMGILLSRAYMLTDKKITQKQYDAVREAFEELEEDLGMPKCD